MVCHKSHTWTEDVPFLCIATKKVNARGHIPLSLFERLETQKRSAKLGHLPGKYPDAGSPPSAMMESKMLPLKLSSMDFPRTGVRPLLFTENAMD